MRTVVVFPDPLGPMRPSTVPPGISSVRPATATTAPKRRVTSRIVMGRSLVTHPVWQGACLHQGDAVGEAAGLGLALGRGALGDTPGAGEGDGSGAHPALPGCMP